MSKVTILIGAILIGTIFGFLSINFFKSSSCSSQKAPEDYQEYIEALTKRLLEAESLNLKHALLLNKITSTLATHLAVLEDKAIEEINSYAQDEAIRLALQLSAYPAPPMPEFDLEDYSNDPDKLSNTINDVFEKYDDTLGSTSSKSMYDDDIAKDKYGSSTSSKEDDKYKEDDHATASLSDEEKTKTCTEWKTKYNVIVGTSWGSLPMDLQRDWVRNSCDYFLLN